MTCVKYILGLCFCFCATVSYAQNSDRDYIRIGNKYFRDKDFNKAETYYHKALDKNKSLEAFYNLGNSLAFQNKDSVAFEQYKQALAQVAETPEKKAFVYHNMGNMSYITGRNLMKANSPDAVKSFAQAVELYKSALRCNPNDNETRYNLAMAQYMLKKNQQNNGNNGNDNKQNQQDQNKNKQDQNKDKQDQNKDKQDQNKDKQDQNKDKQDQNKDKQNQNKNKQDQNKNKLDQNKDNQQEGQMDEKTAEQLLNSAQQDEKAVQRKVQKAERAHSRGLDKDW